jgi:selenocysteine lyase/cysteine desulfurase
LIDGMISRLRDAGATVITPSDSPRRAGIVTVRAKNTERASERLAREGVLCALREGAIRISPHFYTTRQEADRAVEVLLAET